MELRQSSQALATSLEQVRELLEKHRLVEHLIHTQESPRQELVESLTHRQNLAELRNRISRLHFADVAYILDNLPPGDRSIVWEQVAPRRRGDVLVEVADPTRRQLVESLPREALLAALARLDADDITYLAADVPEDVLKECLESLSAEQRSWLQASISFPEDVVGHFMSNIMLTVRDTDTLASVAAQLRQMQELPSHTDKLFVLDRRGVFRGVLPIHTLLLKEPENRVAQVMATDVVTFNTEDEADAAAQAFERYDLVSAPVLNERGKVVGRLTVDVMMDFLRESNTEDMLRLAGLSTQEDLFLTIWKSARNRWLWLFVNLGTAFVASRVIGAFETSIEQLVALAALMPIVASLGGNTGNQTTALVLRAITMGHLDAGNTFYLVRKELGISILNGLLFGAVVGLFAYIIYGNVGLGVVIAAAMLLNLLIAAGVGLAAPMTLERLGRDPALGSSVLLTATTDIMGFLIFLGLATLFLF
jgi:magnesium transporter